MAHLPFQEFCPLIMSNKRSLILKVIRSCKFSLFSCGLTFEYTRGAQQVRLGSVIRSV
jgi:hypothetical protein